MTEAEWLACTDPEPMLEFLARRASDRKLRLFACACCRCMDRRGNATGLAVVELAEQVADGWMQLDEATRRESLVRRLSADTWALGPDLARLARLFSGEARLWQRVPRAALLRDLFGNPFRPAASNPVWRTPDVVGLATAAYDRAFDRLPILGDALEEAGCTDQAILSHCREPGPHVRGCWVVDLVLGKS